MQVFKLINTGWTGGAYGTSRMKLKYTRSMITAALNGELDNVAYKIMWFWYCYPTRMS
jgi:ATP-dependent phosphoenolpyruvate carboxykinase